MWKFFLQKKRLTNHVEREHHLCESKPNVLKKPTIFNNNSNINSNVSAFENDRHVVGPSNTGKTEYMLKKLEKR